MILIPKSFSLWIPATKFWEPLVLISEKDLGRFLGHRSRHVSKFWFVSFKPSSSCFCRLMVCGIMLLLRWSFLYRIGRYGKYLHGDFLSIFCYLSLILRHCNLSLSMLFFIVSNALASFFNNKFSHLFIQYLGS